MRVKRRVKFGFGIIVAAVLAAGGVVLHAQESTEIQRRACRPDVYRLCKSYIPSHAGITYCLHKYIDQLSPDCRAVIEGRLR